MKIQYRSTLGLVDQVTEKRYFVFHLNSHNAVCGIEKWFGNPKK